MSNCLQMMPYLENTQLSSKTTNLFPEKKLRPAIPSVLQGRMDKVRREILQGMYGMEIPSSISSKVVVRFNLQEITANPRVRQKGDKILLRVPLLFLIEPEDAAPSSPVKQWMINRVREFGLSEKDVISLKILEIAMKNRTMAEKAKKFVLYHELAHIFHRHIFCRPRDNAESRRMEKEADLTAAKFSGEAEGGVYLFNIMSQCNFGISDTHPSGQSRAAYLRKYQESHNADPVSAVEDVDLLQRIEY